MLNLRLFANWKTFAKLISITVFRVKKNSPLGFSLRLEKGTIVVQVIIMTMEALTF